MRRETVAGDGTIRRLAQEDAEKFAGLRREALRDEPLAFASSPTDDVAASAAALRAQLSEGEDSVVFGALADGALVGIAGVYRDRHAKQAHRAHLWGMYVRPSYRRRGFAGRLLRAALRHAASLPGVEWVHLGVTSTAREARALYEAAGFVAWGEEPDALRHDGEVASELHMVLRLEPRVSA